jgi:uncharacterized protein (DUF1330 family)
VKYYAVAELDIIDPGWVPEYVRRTTEMVERHGGRYLARTSNFEKIEGDREPPGLYLLIEWPSKEAADAFYASSEYRPLLESRIGGSRGDFALVAGEDVTGAARM